MRWGWKDQRWKAEAVVILSKQKLRQHCRKKKKEGTLLEVFSFHAFLPRGRVIDKRVSPSTGSSFSRSFTVHVPGTGSPIGSCGGGFQPCPALLFQLKWIWRVGVLQIAREQG